MHTTVSVNMVNFTVGKFCDCATKMLHVVANS